MLITEFVRGFIDDLLKDVYRCKVVISDNFKKDESHITAGNMTTK